MCYCTPPRTRRNVPFKNSALEDEEIVHLKMAPLAIRGLNDVRRNILYVILVSLKGMSRDLFPHHAISGGNSRPIRAPRVCHMVILVVTILGEENIPKCVSKLEP